MRQPRFFLKLALFFLLTLAAALAAVGVYASESIAAAIITPGGQPVTGSPGDYGLTYREVTLTTADGLRISGWYLPGRTPNAVILAHGIGGNRQELFPAAIMLVEAGYHVLTIDLRGYGRSEGTVRTFGYTEALDIQAGVDFLLDQPGIRHVGAMGFSLGGATIIRAARLDDRIEALVILSSFDTLEHAARDQFRQVPDPFGWMLTRLVIRAAERRVGLKIGQVNPAQDLAEMSPRPVFIIHGLNDPLFPPTRGQALFNAAPGPKRIWLVEGVGHELPLNHPQEARQKVLTFFQEAFTDPHEPEN